jgi:hypothetical protein
MFFWTIGLLSTKCAKSDYKSLQENHRWNYTETKLVDVQTSKWAWPSSMVVRNKSNVCCLQPHQ